MKKLTFFYSMLLIVGIGFISCSKDPIDTNQLIKDQAMFNNENNVLLKDFGLALARSLKLNHQLRSFIKNEALKKFDKDYEILIYKIKDAEIEKGETFEQIINKNSESAFNLSSLLHIYPTLTILVPKLPDNSFSPEQWNVDDQIPYVAIRLNTTNDVPIITPEGKIGVLPSNLLPGFPVLVIKKNERLVSNLSSSDYIKTNTRPFYKKNGISFKFLDNRFNNLNPRNDQRRVVRFVDPILYQAYQIYDQNNPNLNGWQRDYIYYRITPTNPNGPFLYDYKETLTSFSMTGDPMAAYRLISDQRDDPQFRSYHPSWMTHWTDGNYEFRVTTLINSRTVGSEIVNLFSVNPNDLFELRYQVEYVWVVVGGIPIRLKFYKIKNIKTKSVQINVPIFQWDLDTYATSVKLKFEEVDIPTTTVITNSIQLKFANNFEFNPTLGQDIKIGMKFGGQLTSQFTRSVQRTITQGHDELGEAIVNFQDKIITSVHRTSVDDSFDGSGYGNYTSFVLRDYNTGACKFNLVPKKVQ